MVFYNAVFTDTVLKLSYQTTSLPAAYFLFPVSLIYGNRLVLSFLSERLCVEARAQSTPRTPETPQTPLPQQSYLIFRGITGGKLFIFGFTKETNPRHVKVGRQLPFEGNWQMTKDGQGISLFYSQDTVRLNEFSEELLQSQWAGLIAWFPCRFLLWNLEY